MSDNQRQIELIKWLQHSQLFLGQQLTMVSGDASFRRYFRFSQNGQSFIAVDAPPPQENCQAFVAFSKAYRQQKICVPEVLAVDLQQGFMCLEDFGDQQFSQKIQLNNPELYYQQALALLPGIQGLTHTSLGPIANYDQSRLDLEASLFSQWLVNTHLNLTLSKKQIAMLNNVENMLAKNFLTQPQVAVHRDFHSRNLMILDNHQIGVIDFQDTLMGPITYDLVSLLRDCYVRWPNAWVIEQLQIVWSNNYKQYSWPEFKRWFDWTGIQRHLKAAGIFARLYHRDNKAVYMQDIPRTLGYVIDVAAEYPELLELSQWLKASVLPAVESSLPIQGLRP
ncbi:phosphotransferase [Alteromonadaceae bacterium BrNp21-10]|nr:phosphotransferase [Alteromonadaceae bacterium BrNp21-10]